jgi:hypothetical protein
LPPPAEHCADVVSIFGQSKHFRRGMRRHVGTARQAGDDRWLDLNWCRPIAYRTPGLPVPRMCPEHRSAGGRLLGRTRSASRFATASAFASYAGVAPIEVVSADRSRARSWWDRQLNLALHIIALT